MMLWGKPVVKHPVPKPQQETTPNRVPEKKVDPKAKVQQQPKSNNVACETGHRKPVTPTQEVAKPAANGQQAVQEQPKFNFREMKKKADLWDKGELPPKAQEKLNAAQKEVDTYKSQLEAIKGEYETEKGRFTENQTWRMAFEHRNTPEYRENVAKPFQDVQKAVTAIAQRYGVGKMKMEQPATLFSPEALWDAATEPDEFERRDKIDALLEGNRVTPDVRLLSNFCSRGSRCSMRLGNAMPRWRHMLNSFSIRSMGKLRPILSSKPAQQKAQEASSREEAWKALQ